MTALAAHTIAPVDADLISLTLHVSDDQETWHRIVFEGGSAAYVDTRAAAYIAQRPYLAVEMDEHSTCWGMFPETFDALFASITTSHQVVQVQTL